MSDGWEIWYICQILHTKVHWKKEKFLGLGGLGIHYPWIHYTTINIPQTSSKCKWNSCHAVMIHRNNLYKVSLLTWSELHGKLWAQEPQANRDVWKLVWILNIFDKWEEHHDDNMSNWVLWYLRLPKSLGLPLEEKVDSKGKAAGEEICRTSEKVHWCQRAQKGVPNSVDPIWWPQCFCQMLTLPISFIRCVVTGLDHLMRCGNSKALKRSQVYPKNYGKAICALHQKWKDLWWENVDLQFTILSRIHF